MIRDFPEDYQPLCRRLGLDRGIPYTENWSAAADFLELLVDSLLQRPPEIVLECSSGLSTLILAGACRLAGGGRVISLENGATYAEATRAALAVYGLGEIAQVVHAPLRETPLGDGTWQWYDLAALPALRVQMLVIDGPPGFLQPLSRYPALPMLAQRLAPGCRIFLDDAARADERALVARWVDEYHGLAAEYRDTRRGCAVLHWPG